MYITSTENATKYIDTSFFFSSLFLSRCIRSSSKTAQSEHQRQQHVTDSANINLQ